jgi:hypothetical protein
MAEGAWHLACLFNDSNEPCPCPHDDWLSQFHPAALANSRYRHEAKPIAGSGVHLVDLHLSPRLNAFQVEARNDPIVSELEGEVRIVVEGMHRRFSFISLQESLQWSDHLEQFPNAVKLHR